MSLLDILFPKRCVNCRTLGSYVCSACLVYFSYDPERICLHCNRASLDGLTHPGCRKPQGIDGSFSALAYNAVMKKYIFTFKYKPYVSDLKRVLGALFLEGMLQNEQFMRVVEKRDAVLMPIPLYSAKHRSRGYNHALLLASEIEDKMGITVVDELTRVRKTKSQFLLKKADRAANLKDAFALKKGAEEKVRKKTIFLVDDLVTTGSTLKEAAKVLKRAGAREVYGVTLAHGH